MAPGTKNVVFDIIGTCVSYDVFYSAISSRLGSRLQSLGVSTPLFAFAWIETAEREYTYLAISGHYQPFNTCLSAIFYRVLYQSGIAFPRDTFTDEDCDFLMKAYGNLAPREGLKECFSELRGAGFEVWGLTMGDRDEVAGYFERAGVEMPRSNLMSCDSTGVSKPHPDAFRPMLERLSAGEERPWFAAAHMWDVSAAARVGFRGAYCSVWESEGCPELYGGKMEVMADTLPEMAEEIIAASKK